MTEPVYQSNGVIGIVHNAPTPRDPEGRAVMPNLDALVERQVALLQSRRVIQKALENRDLVRAGSNLGVVEFKERLQVDRKDGSQHFVPRFTHRKPEVASAGVNAVIQAYAELVEKVGGSGESTLARLRARVATLVKHLRDLDQEAQEARKLGDARTVRRLHAEKENAQVTLAQTKAALEHAEAERAAKGRVRVLSMGDLPVSPHKDRRKVSAVGLGAAGIGLGVFLVMLQRVLQRRRNEAVD
jgi:uncharacterized protein involved in exopolysaccharide biosynthesis